MTMQPRRRHRHQHSRPQPLDRLYNYCIICNHSWDQATRPTCSCYPGSEAWEVQFLSTIPAFDMSPRHSNSPPLKFNQPMVPPVEPTTPPPPPSRSSHRTPPKPAYKWYDRTWAVPSPIIQNPREITSPYAAAPPPPAQSYHQPHPPHSSMTSNNQWQSLPYGAPPQQQMYYVEAAKPVPPPQSWYPDPKIDPRREERYRPSSSSSRYNTLPPAYPRIEAPRAHVPDPRVPFMYRKRDNVGYR